MNSVLRNACGGVYICGVSEPGGVFILNRSHHLTRRLTSFAVLFALVILAVSFLKARRTQATERALLFEPAIHKSVSVPAGTEVAGVMKNTIPSSFGVGDTVTAFVSAPVILDGGIVVPINSPLKGIIEKLTVTGTSARVQVHFTEIDLSGGRLAIQTGSVLVDMTIQSEVEVLRDAVSMLMGATLGAATKASSKDPWLVERGLLDGVNSSVVARPPVAIHLMLQSPLHIQN
jgi:hypothetical protein